MANYYSTGSDGITRCSWPGNDELYISYHDHEWGFPEREDSKLFEKICLEGFQSGLSWLTILRKRDNFRQAFSNFNLEIVSKFGEKEIVNLLHNEGIVRHEGKIRSVINNSQKALQLIEEQGSLAHYFYSQPELIEMNRTKTIIPSETEHSVELSKDLKRRGWTWIGPTTIYSFMQAMGVVNDHIHECEIRKIVELDRREFFS
ncbi:MAG: DNA-3-methyladenine glycosylase I [Acidimicrobiales bacterium]|jgi:DNA-3-methyladenine glycosylase I|nr:DNA-3-methyladenine glycosylase I [Acidimicrobiales bacterium]MDP6299342.1 DNA-3-methyladenine glycosylase I [Acidimicrobiales bacterium]HJM28694.1 DNA-3-methyladenine glycosylase I [Acidimicrobiales bacterium]HJM97490.1 DNA-3-methyladenine glycosylase I [Acidimicrobiales bacterium]